MKFHLTNLLTVIACLSYGQENALQHVRVKSDSLEITSAKLKSKTQQKFDSLNNLALKQKFTDSLSVLAWGDSVKNRINSSAKGNIQMLNNKIDSLQSLNLSTDKLKQKIDSINHRKEQLVGAVNSKQQELLGKSEERVKEWQDKVKSKLGLNMSNVNSATTDLGGKPIGDLNLPVNNLKLPGVDLPNANLPLNDLSLELGDLNLPSLESVDFQNLELPTDLKGINQSLPFSKVEGLQEWQGKLSGVTDKGSMVKDIKTNPDKVIETAATNISQVNDVQKVLNTNALDQSEYGALLKNVKDEEAMKTMLTDQAKKEVINHFAGKEQALQSAMQQIEKYKQSYSSVNSLSEIKSLKRLPNPMKGKPFIERMVPGIMFQIHVKNYLNFDVNPYTAYRLTGRISAGLGWNQRWALDWGNKSWVQQGNVYGPRIFTDIKLKRGFSVRVEGEAMNTYIPPFTQAPGEGKREWLYTTMTGLKKEYRFTKKVKGFTLVQFDLIKLFIPNHKSPYGDVVNARFGFEFPLKKKVKDKAD